MIIKKNDEFYSEVTLNAFGMFFRHIFDLNISIIKLFTVPIFIEEIAF